MTISSEIWGWAITASSSAYKGLITLSSITGCTIAYYSAGNWVAIKLLVRDGVAVSPSTSDWLRISPSLCSLWNWVMTGTFI